MGRVPAARIVCERRNPGWPVGRLVPPPRVPRSLSSPGPASLRLRHGGGDDCGADPVPQRAPAPRAGSDGACARRVCHR